MTTFVWNPNASGDWSDKNDWLPLGPPTAGSDVIISTLTYQTITYSNGSKTVNSLSVGNDLFQLEGGQLAIASAASFAATALIDGGTLVVRAKGTATFSDGVTFGVAGGYAGVGATLSGPGVTATSGATTVEDETPGYDPLSLEHGANWVNKGTVNDAGVISVEDNNSRIDNQSSGVFDLTSDDASIRSGHGVSAFDNEGTLAKTGGPGVSKIDVKLDTTGVVSATSGTLEFDGGGLLAGTFSTTGSGVIALGDGIFRAGATMVTLGGAVEVDGGTLSPGAGKTLTLSGVVAFGVAGGYAGVGATLSGPGVTATSGTTTVEDETPGYGPLSLENAADWVNTGTVNDAGTISVEDNNSRIDNQFGGVFDLTTDDASLNGGDGNSVFDNEGAFAKTGGAGVSKIDPRFDTTGVVSASSGTLEFDGGGSFAGLIDGGAAISIAGASIFRKLTITGGLTVTNSSTITQEGNLALGAAFVNGSGATYTISSAGAISALSGGSFSNAGYLYKVGSGASTIGVALQNSGTIEVQGGSLDLTAAVTGAGGLEVQGSGTLELGATAKTSEDVEFSGSSLGTLILKDLAGASGQLFQGAVSDFASGDRIDIGAPFGKGTHLSFAENANSTAGVLTVTNGQHQASLELIGDYLAASFTLTADGGGGMYLGYKS